jgi:DNA-binding response OmpR family regulator
MNDCKILISGDNQNSVRTHAAMFRYRGIQATTADFSTTSIQAALQEAHDLVLLDLYEPPHDPRPIYKGLRMEFLGPILLLAYDGDERFHLHAYQDGIDESINKPISVELLTAKTNAWLKRAQIARNTEYRKSLKQQHGFTVNMNNRQVTIPTGGSVRLSKHEFDLLCLFLNQPNRIFESSHIVDAVWCYNAFDTETEPESLVKNLVYRLRRKIEPDPSAPQYIQNIPSLGYKFCLP